VAFQTASAPAAPVAYRGWLSRSWELDLKDRNDTFTLRPYRDNSVLPFSYNFRPNRAPSSPTHAASRLYGGDVRHAEGRFQLSLKSRIVNDAFGTPLDLWIGYTQQSFWQMYNGKWSSPFRETDFEPELIATVPVRVNVFGLPLRFAGAGIVHQSNGQTDPLSRSWNRVYGMLGFERGHWSVLARGWARLHENRRSDDNPDLTDYMGYGDLTFHYEWGETALQTLVRYNPRTGYGAFDARVTFPIKGFLRGFVSYFDGYGESLLDYNHHNRTIGIGVTFSDWKIR
jgi:phospholipase A1